LIVAQFLIIIKIAVIKEGAIKFWNNLVNRIKHLPKRKQLILVVVVGLALLGIGILTWAIITGKIKPFAAGNQIINTATVTYQDQSGGNHTVNSNTVITDLTSPATATVNLSIALQGRQLPDSSTNYTTSLTSLTAYVTGTTTNPALSKTDITTDATGKSTFTITTLPSGNYDFKLKVKTYLTKTLTNQPSGDPLNLNYTNLRGGDLNNDDIVNSIDYASLNAKWGQSDPTADINQDGIVNSIDFALMNSNWFAQGQ
jgi:hypothetical protein